MNDIQLLGLGGDVPITLGTAQLHGDRRLLREHPETVHLYIRRGKSSSGTRKGKVSAADTYGAGSHYSKM